MNAIMSGMMPSRAIEVMPAARFAAEYEALARSGRPAVVTGLFEGQPIEALDGIAEARALIGAVPVVMSRNYIDSKLATVQSFIAGRKRKIPIERQPTSFGGYLDLAAREPDTRWIIGEQPAPAQLLALADLRSLGVERIASGYSDRHTPRAREVAHALIFVANGSNGSDLHIDWDGQDVLLYQGFGRKRVTIFPAPAAPLLHPIDVYGTLRLSGMPEAARRDFLEMAGGVEHLLEPGQTMFMPAFVWHHVEYLEMAMSVSIRFGGITDPDALFLIDNMHRDFYVQNLMAASRDRAKEAGCRAAIREIRRAFDQPYPSARAKYRALRALTRERCLALGLIHVDYPPQTWLDFEDLLEGAQIAPYQFLAKGSRRERWLWHSRERARSLLRRLANRIAYWA
jgi:hypothetical protein